MIDACSAAHQASGFIGSITGYIDCQSQTLGLGAWMALAMPSSTLAVVLTGFLTITIALIGYNLLLGSTLTVREMTLAFVKIGAVFALATSWPAYRTIVYDLVTEAPAQLVAEVGPRAGVVGSDGTLVQRLDLTDHALVQLAVLGAGQASPEEYKQVQPPPFVGFDSFALGGSRILFLLSSIAGLAIVRVIAGLLLAFGPFFIAFLMFDATRSLFEGWIRVLAGAALSTVAVSIVLGLELGLSDPWLSNVLARRMAGEPLPSVPTELFVITCLFAIAVLASVYASMRVMGAFRLSYFSRHSIERTGTNARTAAEGAVRVRPLRSSDLELERSRAAAIAGAVSGGSLYARNGAVPASANASSARSVAPLLQTGTESVRQSVPLGRSFSRRPGARVSALATKRDVGA